MFDDRKGDDEGNLDRSKFKKLEMPVFSEVDFDDWMFQAERYFDIHHLSDSEKATVSVISFTGKALAWYRWNDGRPPFRDWGDLKLRLFTRFGSSKNKSLCAKFLAIKQEGTVEEYIEAFETTAAPLPHLTEEILENAFINGLDPVISTEVLCWELVGLEKLMRKAQLVEDRELAWSKRAEENGAREIYPNPKSQATQSTTTAKQEVPPTRTITLPSSTSIQKPITKEETPFKRLSEAEFQSWKEKGLCYRCDERYTVGHRCKGKELRVLWFRKTEPKPK